MFPVGQRRNQNFSRALCRRVAKAKRSLSKKTNLQWLSSMIRTRDRSLAKRTDSKRCVSLNDVATSASRFAVYSPLLATDFPITKPRDWIACRDHDRYRAARQTLEGGGTDEVLYGREPSPTIARDFS